MKHEWMDNFYSPIESKSHKLRMRKVCVCAAAVRTHRSGCRDSKEYQQLTAASALRRQIDRPHRGSSRWCLHPAALQQQQRHCCVAFSRALEVTIMSLVTQGCPYQAYRLSRCLSLVCPMIGAIAVLQASPQGVLSLPRSLKPADTSAPLLCYADCPPLDSDQRQPRQCWSRAQELPLHPGSVSGS